MGRWVAARAGFERGGESNRAGFASTIVEMSDTFSLSLWYPQMQMATLDEKLGAVLRLFAEHGGERGVFSATVWPVNWREAVVYQQVYGLGEHACQIDIALEEAFEFVHADYAWEFQIGWTLWEPEIVPGRPTEWERKNRLVRVLGYGPEFDEGAWAQEGHIRVDFGTDDAFLQEGLALDDRGLKCIEENVRQLIGLADALEKETGASGRLLWSELGETLADRLLARLNRVQ